MSLVLSLSNALTGLNVSKQALATLSNNIANANTPGYSRKVLDISSNIVNSEGAGARVDEIARKVDEYLIKAVQRQGGVFANAEIINQYADRMQVLLGRPGNGDAIDGSISDFFNVLQALADAPERGSQRLGAVNAGISLARKLSQLSSDIQELRYQADVEIRQLTTNANSIIRQLEGVNVAINTAFNSGRSTAELLDKRDILLNELGSLIDINYFNNATGSVNVSTNSGVALLDSARYEIDYSPQNSAQAFAEDGTLSPVLVYRVDDSGNRIGTPVTMVTGGTSADVTTGLVTAKMRGLIDLRDTKLPRVLQQLDMLASRLRDEVNAVHNAGSAYPGANSYTGTRFVGPQEVWEWSGRVRIAVLQPDGRPIESVWTGETSGFRPLTIDFSTLDTGEGDGKPSMQGIIDEINQHFIMPQNKASLGDINNIRLASDVQRIPSSTSSFEFDFDLENIAADSADFFVTGVQILDDTATDITALSPPLTSALPSVSLAATGTFATTTGSNTVVVTSASAHGLQNGDTVFISDPGVAINGIASSEFNGFFTIKNITANTFEIEVGTDATGTGSVNVAAQTAMTKYATANAGEVTRTRSQGTISTDLTANLTSEYYTVVATVATKNADGSIKIGTVQYRVNNGAQNILNERYSAEAVTGQAELALAQGNTPILTAMLVDENGVELPKSNGIYVDTQRGYLKIIAGDTGHVVAVDSLNSQQLGLPNASPAQEGTNRGFSHYFELNNFFESNVSTDTGDTVQGSAFYMAVTQRLQANPNLISLGTLAQTARPTDPSLPPLYTYERAPGDNSIIQRLAGLATARVQFQAAGGLGDAVTDFSGYSGEILGFIAAEAANTGSEVASQKTIKEGFDAQLSSIAGVNLDEELANTILYQNSYTASARIITVTNSLFDTLLNSVQA